MDSPLSSKEELKQARPYGELFPELPGKMRKNHSLRPPLERPKKAISLRPDQDVIDKFKATGPGWQSRINEVLKQSMA